MAELELMDGTSQQHFQKLISDAVNSIEIVLDKVQAKTIKLTAENSSSSKHVASNNPDWESTITEALNEGARMAILENKGLSSGNLEDEVSNLSQALIENDSIVALFESILGVQNTEPPISDIISEETVTLSNVTKAINALEDFCKVISPKVMKAVLNEAAYLPRILQVFYSFASQLFFCKLIRCMVYI